MNFDLGPDELALRDGMRELCAGRFGMDRVRAGFDAAGWAELAEAGVFSLRLPEERGGIGAGMTEAAIVFQELGRALVPGPLVQTHVAAGLVEGADSGRTVVTMVDGGVAEHADIAGAALVLNGGVQVVMDGLAGRDLQPLDPLTPVRRVTDVPPGAAVDADPHRVLREATVLTAALSSGIASRLVEIAVAYAMERTQFDRPIATFQAVKHMCADMLVRAELARAAVDAAAVGMDEDAEDVASAVSGAKLLASEAGIDNAKACIQVHGGMGFTWEVDAHLYLKRAVVLAQRFGGSDEHALRVADAL